MADRIALAIEPDNDTANQIERLLEPKGFQVESISNGDEAMEWGRTNKPAVIILSVEPRKVGYAISNKLRRSPSLREVPLVLISSEETLATFEQHKKLKSRADEYLLKPLEESVFVSKVAGLVGMGHGDEDVHELDADSDIVLSTRMTRTSSSMATTTRSARCWPATAFPNDTSEQQVARHGPDAVRGREVRSRDPGGVRRAGGRRRARGRRRATTWSICGTCGRTTICRRTWAGRPGAGQAGDDQIRAKKIRIVTARARRWVPRSSSRGPRCPRRSRCWARRFLPHWPRSSSATVATDASGVGVLAEGFVDERRVKEAEARNSELEARIHSLENERQTLRKEIEEARERFTQSATFSKEREFLGLREIINKKEKDILDLRDALDAKERQILDHKDKLRELESRAARSGRGLARVRAQPGRRQRAASPSWRRTARSPASARRGSRRGSTTRTRSCARRARRSTR